MKKQCERELTNKGRLVAELIKLKHAAIKQQPFKLLSLVFVDCSAYIIRIFIWPGSDSWTIRHELKPNNKVKLVFIFQCSISIYGIVVYPSNSFLDCIQALVKLWYQNANSMKIPINFCSENTFTQKKQRTQKNTTQCTTNCYFHMFLFFMRCHRPSCINGNGNGSETSKRVTVYSI